MKKLCILIVLITIVGILPSLLQYGCFVLATDMAAQEVPFIIETKRMLMSGYPFWSWNHFLGDNFIGSYSFYTLTSPFVWINCLFPDQWMLYGITFTLMLKMLCTGLACYCFLRKMSVSTESSIIGSLMYTFSSYAVSNLFYYHFLDLGIVSRVLYQFLFRCMQHDCSIHLFGLQDVFKRNPCYDRANHLWLAACGSRTAVKQFHPASHCHAHCGQPAAVARPESNGHTCGHLHRAALHAVRAQTD